MELGNTTEHGLRKLLPNCSSETYLQLTARAVALTLSRLTLKPTGQHNGDCSDLLSAVRSKGSQRARCRASKYSSQSFPGQTARRRSPPGTTPFRASFGTISLENRGSSTSIPSLTWNSHGARSKRRNGITSPVSFRLTPVPTRWASISAAGSSGCGGLARLEEGISW